MTDVVRAPWTDEQVKRLNEWQTSNRVHPFTCGREHAEHVRLIATTDGWVCGAQDCDYTQDWAHLFMTEPLPPPPEWWPS